METDVFPGAYNKTMDEIINSKVDEARKKSSSRINSINKSRTSAPERDKFTWWGFCIGFFGGFIACSCVCINNNSAGGGFATWVVVGIICGVIGYALDKSVKDDYDNNQANADFRVYEEEELLQKEIQNIRNEAQNEKYKYLMEFEKNAKSMSVQFAESELAQEIIEWMTKGFSKTIDAADRRSYREVIEVPFVFDVYDNKITCNLGTFDFELKRCRNLNNPLEQTALAIAIASAIQLNVIMKYPKDSSGTDISIDISYLYTSEYPITTITYVAPNGNYKAVRSW